MVSFNLTRGGKGKIVVPESNACHRKLAKGPIFLQFGEPSLKQLQKKSHFSILLVNSAKLLLPVFDHGISSLQFLEGVFIVASTIRSRSTSIATLAVMRQAAKIGSLSLAVITAFTIIGK